MLTIFFLTDFIETLFFVVWTLTNSRASLGLKTTSEPRLEESFSGRYGRSVLIALRKSRSGLLPINLFIIDFAWVEPALNKSSDSKWMFLLLNNREKVEGQFISWRSLWSTTVKCWLRQIRVNWDQTYTPPSLRVFSTSIFSIFACSSPTKFKTFLLLIIPR